MAERPILFSGPMVQAILDGRKTQTRRVMRLQPTSPATIFDVAGGLPVWAIWPSEELDDAGHPKDHGIKCPYGRPGDRLWVREAFLPYKQSGVPSSGIEDATYVCFRDGSQTFKSGGYYHEEKQIDKGRWPAGAKWRPSIHMPRWASRITLEITAVRVERLQAIGDTDAMAEGITRGMFGGFVAPGVPLVCADGNRGIDLPIWKSPKEAIAASWDHINGKSHPWESNPWVWVVEFRKAVSS